MARQTYRVTALADRHAFIKLSDRIALITRALKRSGKNGRRAAVVAAYFGFSTQDEAIEFIAGLRHHFKKAFCQVRRSERLNTPYEVKVRSFEGLEAFIWKFVAIVTSTAPTITAAAAKAAIFPPAIGSKVVSFDRSNAPLAHRSPPRHIAGIAID